MCDQLFLYFRFLIPRGFAENGVCFASVIQTYLETLTKDGIMVLSDMPFFFTGRAATNTRVSKFVNSPVGANALRDVGKDIANYLKKPNPEGFTGHCFRR